MGNTEFSEREIFEEKEVMHEVIQNQTLVDPQNEHVIIQHPNFPTEDEKKEESKEKSSPEKTTSGSPSCQSCIELRKEMELYKKKYKRQKKKYKKISHFVKDKDELIHDLKIELQNSKNLIRKIYNDGKVLSSKPPRSPRDLSSKTNDRTNERKKVIKENEAEGIKTLKGINNAIERIKEESFNPSRRKRKTSFSKLEHNMMLSLKYETKREQTVKEFFFSEKRYIESLAMLKNEYLSEMEKRKLVPAVKMKQMFGDFQLIYMINKKFAMKLEEVLFSKCKDEMLVNIILSFSKSFKLYSNYIKNYSKMHNDLISLIKKNKKLENFLNNAARRLKDINPKIECQMSGLLITPVQRIPRYRLLLRDLIKNTKKNTSHHGKLTEACQTIEGILVYCNDQSKEHEEKLNLLSISKKLNLTLIQKKLIFQTENIYRVDRKGNDVEANLYIFNDLLVVKDFDKGIIGSIISQPKQFQIPLIKDETIVVVFENVENIFTITDPVLNRLSREVPNKKTASSRVSNFLSSLTLTGGGKDKKKNQFSVKIKFISVVECREFQSVIKKMELVMKNDSDPDPVVTEVLKKEESKESLDEIFTI